MVASSQHSSRQSLWKSRWISIIMLAADAVGFSICWKAAYYTRVLLAERFMGPINTMEPYLIVHALIVLVGLVNCAVFGLYIHRRRLSSLNKPTTLIRAGYHWLLYIVVVAFFFKELDLGRSIILLSGLYGLIYLFLSRTVLRALKEAAIRHGRGTVRCALVGSAPLALEVRSFLQTHPEIGFTLVGFIGHVHENENQQVEEVGIRVLGTIPNLKEIVLQEKVEEVYLAISDLDHADQMNLLNLTELPGLSVHVVSDIFDVITERIKVEEIGQLPVITLRDGHLPLHQAMLKAIMDYCAGIAGVLTWLLIFHWWIALWIKVDSPGPIFFKQKRVGRDGREFWMWKYRTMTCDAPAYAVAPTEEDDPRITRFGQWLRKTSLDEIPQFINVLKGNMSLVGPRPEMPFIVTKYTGWERRRLDVKPGITGLWQVIGRKNLPLHLNMQYDLYYIKNQSFMLDLEILLRTVPAVWKGKGAF
jgi:exopolysaccharide biosynthesis polyprenyl glycosylphosphotransferase